MKIRTVTIIMLAILLSAPLSAQRKNKRRVVLHGTIVNKDTVPVSDVMIFIDGKKTNRTSDSNGEYKVRFKPDIEKISFLSPEYGAFEVDYVGQEKLDVTVNLERNELTVTPTVNGEVVEAGYGKIREEDLVSSISSIKEDRFKNRSYSNVYEMIVGEVSGVTVEGTNIRIRGITSLNGSNDPLLIVDGSPVYSLSNLSPSDVESINVLKGSATAIYGNRGAAGVVVIKTKRGKK
ncbi:MAG: TonB-dependent receptor plug domain-containing protein [Bacteroidales bacterium]|nr:TonB-dependent receptor plug domain-containing protein [Bacteroidales bacterium]